MTQKIIFLKGLPASGKSTWAKTYCFNDVTTVRLNKDDIREELGNEAWSNEFEKKVLKVQRERGEESLKNGLSLVIDDTNFAEKHKNYWSQKAREYNCEFIEKFFNTSLEDCILRDKSRSKPVGEHVIRMFYNRYLKPENTITDDRYVLEQDPSKTSCIICDIDGTIALMQGRSPYSIVGMENDKPNQRVIDILHTYSTLGTKILFVTGRDESKRIVTTEWLENEGMFVTQNHLFMRKRNDYRKSHVIKKEIFDKYIKGKYFVEFVLEDRDPDVKMWREEGLLCLQVYNNG